jgi:hypothetical protein
MTGSIRIWPHHKNRLLIALQMQTMVNDFDDYDGYDDYEEEYGEFDDGDEFTDLVRMFVSFADRFVRNF